MTSNWEPELLDTKPEEYEFLEDGSYIQRKDIHEVEYHALDGSQTFHGFECLSRLISQPNTQTA